MIGAVIIIESNLSIIPPCPGSICPKSLTPYIRLIRLATRSPMVSSTAPTRPHAMTMRCILISVTSGISTYVIGSMSSTYVDKYAPTTPPISPPIKPDIVFFGDILGQSLGPLNVIPTKYANVSVSMAIRSSDANALTSPICTRCSPQTNNKVGYIITNTVLSTSLISTLDLKVKYPNSTISEVIMANIQPVTPLANQPTNMTI